jgi:hypothetical protein
MRALRPTCLGCLACLLLGSWPTFSNAQLANKKETLRGHRTIFLSIVTPETDEAIQQLGLKKDSLERYILEQLRQNGFEVSTQYTNQTLILEIQVDLLKVAQSTDADVFAFISQFEAIQPARLAANRQAALVTTWRSTKFGAVSRAQVNLLRDSVLQNLAQFIADYRSVQPPNENAPKNP